MEKPTRSKNGLSMFLTRAASDVTFKNPPFSPPREKRSNIQAIKFKTHVGNGHSGPIASIIPAKWNNRSSKTQEPTSPEVSCIGQIKQHNKKTNDQQKLINSLPKYSRKKPSMIRNLFSCAKPPLTKSEFSCAESPVNLKSDARAFADEYETSLPDRGPTLSQMKRFASGRDPTVGFVWNQVQIAPADDGGDYSAEESEGEAPEMMIPFSAPLLMRSRELGGCGDGGISLEPRKEINLWKRRTMAQPRPLQINNLRRS